MFLEYFSALGQLPLWWPDSNSVGYLVTLTSYWWKCSLKPFNSHAKTPEAQVWGKHTTRHRYYIGSVTLTVSFRFKCVQIPTLSCKSSVLHYSMKLHLQELSMSQPVDLGYFYLLYYKLNAAAVSLWYQL